MAARPRTRSSQTAPIQLREELLALVDQMGLAAGDRLPSEAELCALYNVSRSSLREALKALEQEGVLEARRGEGRFVSSSGSLRLERPMTRFESITDMLSSRGFTVSTAVLEATEGPASAEEAAALELGTDGQVIRLLRIRYGDDDPLVVSHTVITRDALPGPIEHRDWSGSITRMLEVHGHYINSSIATMSAVELPDEIAKRYKLEGLGPWLMVREIGLSRSGQKVLFAHDYHRGSEVSFSVLRTR